MAGKQRNPVREFNSSVITWDRVVADEIHYLRNQRASNVSFRQLKAKIVWGLTGTIFQNNIRDLKTIYQCLKFPDYLLKIILHTGIKFKIYSSKNKR